MRHRSQAVPLGALPGFFHPPSGCPQRERPTREPGRRRVRRDTARIGAADRITHPIDTENGSSSDNGGNSYGFWHPHLSPQPPSPPLVMPWSITFLNSIRETARASFFGTVQAGSVQVTKQTGAIAAGNGIIAFRIFISDKKAAGGYLAGDDRGTSDAMDAPFRVAIAWDTNSGEISYTVAKSCRGGWTHCADQDPIRRGQRHQRDQGERRRPDRQIPRAEQQDPVL